MNVTRLCMAKLRKDRDRNLQMHFTIKHWIFTVLCVCVFARARVSRKFYGFLPIQFCRKRIRIAKSTSVITNVMGIFTVTLSHLLRIVVAVCTASLFAFSRREDFAEQDQTWMEPDIVPEIVRKHE